MNANSRLRRLTYPAGFVVGIGFYLLCGTAAFVMGQFMSLGGACTVGAPFLPLLLGPAIGIFWSLTLVGQIILQRAGRFTYGCLTAHGLVLGTFYLLRFLL